jgi:hypothetical protein
MAQLSEQLKKQFEELGFDPTKRSDRLYLKNKVYEGNMKKFINDLIKIEDKDKPGTVIDFKLWDAQERALEKIDNNRFTITAKSRQLGLTWLALSYIMHLILFFEGKSATGISETERDGKELCRRMDFILRHLPNWLVVEKGKEKDMKENTTGITYEYNVLSIEIHHPNGENSVFSALPSKPSAARSFTDNIVLLDEWAYHPRAEQIWTAAYPTINRPGGGKVIGISTGEQGTFFEEIWNNAEWEYGAEAGNDSNLFTGIFLPWDAHPDRDKQWHEDTKKQLPNTHRSQYPSTPSEAFTTGKGAFFTEFERDIHIPYGKEWYPPGNWRIVGAYDGGYNRACFKWYAISNDGWIICYREYYPQKTIDPIQAEDIRQLSRDRDGVPEQIDYIVADTSCWAKNQDTGKTTVEIMEEHGLRPWRQADKDRIMGWNRLHEFLAPVKDEQGNIIKDRYGNLLAKLRYTESCSNTLRLFPGMKSDENTPDDLAPGQEDHVFDTDRYFVQSRPRPRVSKKNRVKQKANRKRKKKPRSKVTGY